MRSRWKTTNDTSKNSLFSSISKGNMSDKTQRSHSCNNDITFASNGTRAYGLGLFWAWMLHETFICLAYWWRKISYDYCIYQLKLLPQQF